MTNANQHLFNLVDGNMKPPRRPVSLFGIVTLVVAVVAFLATFVDLGPTRETPVTAQGILKPQS